MNETQSTTQLLLARPAVDGIRATDASVMSTTYFLIPELPARGPPAEHGGQLDTVGARQRRTLHGCTMELSALETLSEQTDAYLALGPPWSQQPPLSFSL